MLATFSVDSMLDTGDANPGDGVAQDAAGQTTLRAAIMEANARAGDDSIVLPAGEFMLTLAGAGEDGAATGDLDVLPNGKVTITGAGANSTFIDAAALGDRVFHVLPFANLGVVGATIRNGFNETGDGGGVLNSGTLSISSSVLAGNEAGRGGGVFNVGALTLNQTTLSGNAGDGGGIYNSGEAVTITASTISGNSGGIDGSAGGIYNESGTLIITNSTVSGNTAKQVGGISNGGMLTIKSSTIAGNSATMVEGEASSNSGGVANSPAGNVSVQNTIIAGNTVAGMGSPDFSGEADSLGDNLLGDTSGSGGWLASDLQNVDPQLGPLANNGGPTLTHALLPDSPAIDAGNNAGAPSTDQRGAPFSRTVNGTVDIGSYELQSFGFVVDTIVDENDGNFSAGDLSLREAIELTNINPGHDTIQFAESLVGGAGGAVTIALSMGELSITSDLTINGLGAQRFSIAGSNLSRVFNIAAGTTVEIAGLLIREGRSTHGGAISNNGNLTIANSGVHTSSARDFGGGIYNAAGATLTIIGSTVSGNSMQGEGTDGRGGGIANSGALTILNSYLTHNSATLFGAAIYNAESGTLTISGATISDNSATGFVLGIRGGGIYNLGTAAITDTTISSNSASPEGSSGGGIYNQAGALTIDNSTISHNSANQTGGIYNNAELTIKNSTITANATNMFVGPPSEGSGGIANSPSGNVTVQNTIVAGNIAGTAGGTPDFFGTANGLGNNLIGDTTGSNGWVASDLQNVDPLIGPLDNNGGPTRTHALLEGSPAIDAGNNVGAPPTDQRGPPFLRIFNGTVDIGAYERQSLNFVVDTAIDENDGNYDAGDQSLREAIVLTSSSPGHHIIQFAPALAGATITLTLGELLIASNLRLIGLGADQLAISGNNASRVFNIAAGATVDIAGLTIRDGMSAGNGGGILNSGALTVTSSTISGNSIGSFSSGNGGGIYNLGSLSIVSSTISGNAAGGFFGFHRRGGGIHNQSGVVTIANSTISGNSAVYAGGVQNNAEMTIKSSTVTDNTSLRAGLSTFGTPGGIANSEGASLTIQNTIVAGNINPTGTPDVTGDFQSLGNNLIGYTRESSGWVASDLTGEPGTQLDARLGPLADNGGPTLTHGLLAMSPAIDAGSISGSPSTDQRGVRRPRDGDGEGTAVADIGAFELTHVVEAIDDTATVSEDTADNFIDVLANDIATDVDPLSVVLVTQGMHGAVAIGPSGRNVLYTPDPNRFGNDSFTYTITDGNGGSSTATVHVTVTSINDPVDAKNDAFSTLEGTSLTNNVLANDVDPDGDKLSAFLTSTTTNGTLSFVADGSFTYTPNADFNGTDLFTYTATDGNGSTDTAKVTINVSGKQGPPDARDDAFTTLRNTAVSGSVIGNDSDPDGDKLTTTLLAQAENGTAVLNPDGGFVYTPNLSFVGSDSFTYTLSDGLGGIDTAKVEIKVNAPVNNPEAMDDKFTTAEDTPVSGNVLTNDSDPEGDKIMLTSMGVPLNGSLVFTSDGNFTYTPNFNFNGTETFTYDVTDEDGFTDTAKVVIEVTPVNDVDAKDDTYSTKEETALTVPAPGVLGNDVDPEGDDITGVTAFDATSAEGGTVAMNPDGSFTYTPAANFQGPDSFTYTITDEFGATDTAKVTVSVGNENDTPDAVDDKFSVVEGSTNNVFMVMANDTDPDLNNPDSKEDLQVIAVTQAANGAVSIAAGSAVSYTPNGNFVGTDTFTYTISDTGGKTDTATVTVTVSGEDDVIAVDDSGKGFTVLEDTIRTPLDVLKNDIDPEGDSFKVTGVTQGAKGIVEIGAGGANVLYTPDPNFTGTDTFTYTITDSTGATDTATVTVNVDDVGEPPNAVDDKATVIEDSSPNVIDVLANDTDPDPGDKLTVTGITQGSGGTVAIGTDGANVVYAPNAGFSGNDIFTYTITDATGNTDTATVLVTVVDLGPDFTGSDGDDVFYVRLDATGTNVQVFGNDTGTGTPIFSEPLGSTPLLSLNTLAGDDRLIVDSINGNPIPSGGILYLGGGNTASGDRLSLKNGGVTNGSYTASSTTAGSGVVNVGSRAINMTGVEPIDVTAYNNFTVVTPGAADTLTMTRPAMDMLQLAGSSGGVELSPVTFTSVSNFTVDAATNDAGGGNDSLTINASGTVPNNVGFMQYRAGTGTNTLAIADGSVRIDSTMAAGGTLNTTVASGAELITHRFRQSSLSLADDSRAVVLQDGTDNGTSVLTSLTIGDDATLDISDNAVIVDYAGNASPENTIRAKILEGRGGVGVGNGAWTGTGITSSSAAAANALNPESRSVGYGDNGTMPLYSYDVFRGQAVDDTSILIAYTRTADADLNGIVDDNDVTVIGATYNPTLSQPSWALGDFDFNGFVDDNDVTLIGAFYDANAEPYDSSIPAPAPLAAAGDGDAHPAVFAGMADGSAGTSQDSGRSLSAADLAAIADEIFADSDNTTNRKTRFGV